MGFDLIVRFIFIVGAAISSGEGKTEKLSKLLLVVGVLALVVLGQVHPTVTAGGARGSVRDVVLYAHYDEDVPSLEGKVLNTSPVLDHQEQGNATAGNVFTLYPSLGGSLTVRGTVMFRAWLSADSTSYGRLAFTLFEVKGGGEMVEVARIEGYVAVTTRVDEYTFGVAGVNHTFSQGSTLQFRVDFAPSVLSVRTTLYWNGVRTPTQLVLPCVDYVKARVSLKNKMGGVENFFPLNEENGSVRVVVEANLTDPFGTRNLKSSTLTLINSTGHEVVKDEEMTVKGEVPSFYTKIYVGNLTLWEGTYSVLVRVLDLSGNYHSFQSTVGAAYYSRVYFRISDGDGIPLPGLPFRVINPKLVHVSQTNKTGVGEVFLPSSKVLGGYNLTIEYKNGTYTYPFKVSKAASSVMEFTIPLYTLKARVQVFGIPFYGAVTRLLADSRMVGNMTVGSDGWVVFKEVPRGEYTLEVNFLLDSYSEEVSVEGSMDLTVQVHTLYLNVSVILILAALLSTITAAVVKRVGRPRPHHFTFINKLVKGGVPGTATLMISGPPASGKTVLMGNLLHEDLKEGGKCVYVTNIDFPDNVRGHLKNLGVKLKKHEGKRLLFIDCYSAIAGQESKEKHSVSTPNDLTRLGMEISLATESLGPETNVYLDSLSTVIPTLKPEQIVSFIHTTGAKIKGIGGRFCFTVGSEVDPSILMKIDEATDCVIQLRTEETDHQLKRGLRVKKVRGREHYSRWIPISIKPGEGVVFHAEKKMFKKLYSYGEG